jgi:hypothetical protein
MSRSYHTKLKIENYTNTDITNISVSEIDNYDWDGGSRPDHNFHGYSISAGCSKEEREEVNANASNCPFRMTLTFRDGRECSFRINQKYVMGDSSGFSNYGTGVDVDYNKYSGKGHHGKLVVTIKDNQQYLERQRKEAAEKAAREEAARKAAAEKAAREEAARKAAAEKAAREEAARKAAAEKAAREEAARKEAAEKAAREEAARKAAAEKAAREEAARKEAAEKAAREEAAAEKAAREEAARKAASEKAAREEAARKAAVEKAAIEEAARKAAVEKVAMEEAVRKEIAEKAAKEEAAKKLESNVEQLIEKVMELCGIDDHAKAANIVYKATLDQELSQSAGRDILGECNLCNEEYSSLVGDNTCSDYHFHQ